MIDSYLRSTADLDDRAIHLLFSANRWEKAELLEATLASGTTVVCDRYAYSGVAFTSAKQQFFGSSKELDWCRAPDAGLRQPDAVAYLTVPPASAEKRGGFGGERYETKKLQQNVRQRFEELMQADIASGAVGADGDPLWRLVDADGSIAQVEDRLWSAVGNAIQGALEGSNPRPEKLWMS